MAQKKAYFTDNWNRFDFFILVIAYPLLVIIEFSNNREVITVLRIVRVCRIIKLLKLIKLIVNVKKMEQL